MGTHPNVLLIAVLTPDGLARKTMRAILSENKADEDGFKIGDLDIHHEVAEGDWLDNYQIATREGDLLFFDLVTYGYGEYLTWAQLEAKKNILEEWASKTAKNHNCKYEIRVSANYW